MNRQIEPWKLTAYSLGELDAEETQIVHQAIEADPNLQAELQEMQLVISRVQSALQKTSPEPTLTESQRAAINEQIRSAAPSAADAIEPQALAALETIDPPTSRPAPAATWISQSKLLGLAAIAACLFAALFLVPLGHKTSEVSFSVLRSDDFESNGRANRTLPAMREAQRAGASQEEVQLAIKNPNDPTVAGSTIEGFDQPVPTAAYILGDDVQLFPTNPNSLGGVGLNPQEPKFAESSGGRPMSDGLAYGTVPSQPTELRLGRSGASGNLDPRDSSAALALPSISSPGKAPSLPLDTLAWSDRSDREISEKSVVGLATAPPNESKAKGFDDLADDLAAVAESEVPKDDFGAGNRTIKKMYLEELGQAAAAPFGEVAVEFVNELGTVVIARGGRPSPKGDRFEAIVESPFVVTEQSPLSTFSIDVDTASYSKIRQYLMQANQFPQPNAVRIEELINYFEYDYAGPTDEHPFASNMAVQPCPWNEDHKLIRIGLQAKKIDIKERAKSNLVFLLDVSGSMDEPNKLPLVKQAMSMLIRQLGENDRIAMVVYAGAAGCVLPSITGDRQAQILAALEELHAGGSTNGGQGIELAYAIAREHFIPGGINRVILCTDGDFNVGTTSNEALIKLVQEQAKSKVFLTCLGFGIGNYNDSMMEQITNQGNGVYGMVDNALEARRLMIEQLSGTLITVAKDVKIQVEFNPTKIARYRLIGYENRRLANRDFNDDKKDAGEIGAGHRVTALYEIVPVGAPQREPVVDELRYGKSTPSPSPPAPLPEDGARGAKSDVGVSSALSNEWMTLKLRYKQPEADVSSKIEFFLTDETVERSNDDSDFRWTTAVAEFGLLLRRSQQAPDADWERMIQRARSATGNNPYRIECLEMMTKAKTLSSR